MRGDHQGAADESNQHFLPVSAETVALKCSEEDARQPGGHETEDAYPPMHSKSANERYAADESDENGEGPVDSLFRGKKVDEDCGHGEKDRGDEAVDDT